MDFTKKKFLSLPSKAQHKKASELLRQIFEGHTKLCHFYQTIEEWMGLSPLTSYEHEPLSNRFHWHLEQAVVSWKEHSFLHVRHNDKISTQPFLPVHIFLYRLRSAFNVGSILRTAEALRIGPVHFCPTTPGSDHPKVQKASMGTYDQIPTFMNTDLYTLPKPWIALETATPSIPLASFVFPLDEQAPFTLILGNEEFGIPKELLQQCDAIVEIPLFGSKNSLNVAAAFAIVANAIREQKTKASLGKI